MKRGAVSWIVFTLAAVGLWGGAAAAAAIEMAYPNSAWAREDVMRELLDRFERETGIKVEMRVVSDSALPVQYAAGAAPEVAMLTRAFVLEFALAKQMLVDLTPIVERYGVQSADLVPALVEEASFNGALYGYPFDFDVVGAFLWNAQQFAEVGLDPETPPATFALLDEYARKLHRELGDGTLERVGFYPVRPNGGYLGFFWAFGGDAYDKQLSKVTVNDPRNMAALDWFLGYAERIPFDAVLQLHQTVGNVAHPTGAFQRGAVSMGFIGGTYVQQTRDEFPEIDFRVASRPPHAEGGRAPTTSSGLSIAGLVGVPERELAELIRFLTSPEVQVEWYERVERFPARQAALARLNIDDPHRATLAAVAPNLSWRPPFSGAIISQLQNMFERVGRFQVTPQEGLETAHNEITRAFAEAGLPH